MIFDIDFLCQLNFSFPRISFSSLKEAQQKETETVKNLRTYRFYNTSL